MAALERLSCYTPAVPSPPSRFARICGALSTVLALGSPFVLYFAVKSGHLEEGALLLLAYAFLRALPAVLAAKREQLFAAVRLPLVAIAGASVSLVTHDARALLILPSASQVAFAAVFLSSLRGTPLVEHFARMKLPALSLRHIRYCRIVTIVWGGILLAAAGTGLVLALLAPLGVWAAFSTVGSYVIVGVVFSAEYLVRKILFREYGSLPFDRVIRIFFPPPPDPVRTLDLSHAKDGHVEITIPKAYLFFRGHFDGAPMLPGVVQLTEILLPLIEDLDPAAGPLRGLRRVRFRRPVLPGDTLVVDVRRDPTGREGLTFNFELRVGESTVASGAMLFEAT